MPYGFNDDRSKADFDLNALKREILRECNDMIEEAIEDLPSSSVDILTSTKTKTFTIDQRTAIEEDIVVSFNLPYTGRTHKVIGADLNATDDWDNHYLCSAPHISGSGSNFSVRTLVLNRLTTYVHSVETPPSDNTVTLTVKLNYIDTD